MMTTTIVAFAHGLQLPHCRTSPIQQLRSKHSICSLTYNSPLATENVREQKPPRRPRSYRILPDNMDESKRPPRPPNHWSVPLIGIYIEQALGIFKTPVERRDIYGPIHTSNFFLGPRTYLLDYHAILDVMRDNQVFRSKGAVPTFQPMFGDDSLIVLDGKEHAIARAAFAPAFSPSLFPHYFNRALERSHKTWKNVYSKVNTNDGDGEAVRLAPIFRSHYLAIIIEMTTGLNLDNERWRHVPKLFEKGLRMLFSIKFSNDYKQGIAARDELMKILDDLIREKLATRADTIENLRKNGDEMVKLGLKDISLGQDTTVDILLVSIANSSLSTDPNVPIDERVVATLSRSILLLWFAGFITAAVTSMNASFEMGLNDDYYRQLVNEQNSIVSANDGNTEVTYEQISSEMPLLESYLNEILRLYPTARGVSRFASCDVEILGKFVPKGSILFCSFFAAHHDPDIYPDPHTFKLDRFVRERGMPKPSSVLTFGTPGSVHYCLGAAFSKVLMKTTFATLLRGYRYSLDPKQSRKYGIFPEASPESGVVLDMFERRKL